jgi:hypothetical protein
LDGETVQGSAPPFDARKHSFTFIDQLLLEQGAYEHVHADLSYQCNDGEYVHMVLQGLLGSRCDGQSVRLVTISAMASATYMTVRDAITARISAISQ